MKKIFNEIMLMCFIIGALCIKSYADVNIFTMADSTFTITAENAMLKTTSADIYCIVIASPSANSTFTIYDSTTVTGGTSTQIGSSYDCTTVRTITIPYTRTKRGLRYVTVGTPSVTLYYK